MSTGMLTSGASAGGQEKAVAKLAFRRQAVFYIVEHERGKTRGARLRFMQPLRDFCLMRAAARRRTRQKSVQFEHRKIYPAL